MRLLNTMLGEEIPLLLDDPGFIYWMLNYMYFSPIYIRLVRSIIISFPPLLPIYMATEKTHDGDLEKYNILLSHTYFF